MKKKISWIELLHQELGKAPLQEPPENSFRYEDYAAEMNCSISRAYSKLFELYKNKKVKKHVVRRDGKNLTYFTFNEKTKAS